MSGGSKDYIYCRIEEYFVGQMHDKELDDLMADIVDLAHDLEWYESGDYSKEDYIKTVNKFKRKWFGTDRNERLKGYIDETIEKVRKELYDML